MSTSPKGQIIRTIEEDSGGPEAYDPRYPPNSSYAVTGPKKDTPSLSARGAWDPKDNDEQPGEVEIMRDILSSM